MPPDDPITPDPRTPHVEQNVNVTPDSGIFAGLSGWLKPLVAFGFAGVVAAAFWVLLYTGIKLLESMMADQRTDRIAEQQLFRESVRDIQRDADRRAGEVKGALDANTMVMRQLIDELQKARHAGIIRSDSPNPRPAGPMP
jgi:hypothetical protein